MSQKNKTVVKAEPGRNDIIVTREFDAPRDIVFKAFTDPKLVVKWLVPKQLKMHLEKFEARAGGSYRYYYTDDQGNEFAFRGVTHEVAAPERIIQTFEFEGLPEKGHVALETARFEVLPNNRTRLVNQSLFQSEADRDGMIESGMEIGVSESYENLDKLLAEQ